MKLTPNLILRASHLTMHSIFEITSDEFAVTVSLDVGSSTSSMSFEAMNYDIEASLLSLFLYICILVD